MKTRKEHLKTVRPEVELYRDATGPAWVENGESGNGHSCHPNIDASGSVAGMRRHGAWGKKDRTVRSHGFIYNVSLCAVGDDLDELARRHCQCGGNHDAPPPAMPTILDEDRDTWDEGDDREIRRLAALPTLGQVNGNELKEDEGGERTWLMFEPRSHGCRVWIEYERRISGRWAACDARGNELAGKSDET